MIDEKNDQCKIKQKSSSLKQYLSVAICSFTAIMYGQTVGWSSAAVPQLERGGSSLPSGENGIDSMYSGWVGGAFCLGGLFSAPVYGLLADAKGRKFAAYLIGICFMIQWSLVSFGGSMTLLLIGRVFGGAGSAGSVTISSIYSNEVAEKRIRGLLGGFLALFYVIGIFSAFIVGAYASFYLTTYIYLTMSILFIPAWWRMPETPAYLLLCSREKEALKTLMWLRSCSENDAKLVVEEIKLQQAGASKPATILEFFKHPASRKGLLLGSILTSIQSFSGIFAVHSYASTIFKRAGGILDPFTSTIIYGGLMCIGAVLPLSFVDKYGRKVLLILSSCLLMISMIVLGFYFWGVSRGYLSSEFDISNDKSFIDIFVSLLPITALSWAVLVYYIGLGSVAFVTLVELYLDEMRGVGGSCIAIVGWLTGFILLQFFGPCVEIFGDHSVFFFFSFVCFSGIIFISIFIPETKNKSSQEIADYLIKGR